MFALEIGPHKIRVNSVNPFLIPTGMTKPLCTEEIFKGAVAKTPIGQQLELKHVVELVLFLLNDQSVMITGTINLIDGGYTCQLP